MMKRIATLLLLFWICATGVAAVKLPAIFSNQMVLQRNQNINIWGWASKGERIRVQFAGQSLETKADKNGEWNVKFDPMSAGGPFTLVVRGENTITIDSLFTGDVWICSGQSNMQWSINCFAYAAEEAQKANDPLLHLFTVPREMAVRPQNNINGGEWNIAIGDNILDFSAVGYFFGQYLRKHVDVPIGLISTNWGGTVVQTWMSPDAINQYDVYEPERKMMKDYPSLPELQKKLSSNLEEWKKNHYLRGPGLENSWFDPETDFSQWNTMVIPGDENHEVFEHNGVVWLAKTFDLPETFMGKELTIELLRIYDFDRVWLNGEIIGETYNPYTYRRYKAADSLLRQNDNVLVLRVFSRRSMQRLSGSIARFNVYPSGLENLRKHLAGEYKYKPIDVVDPESLPDFWNPNIHPNHFPSLLYNAMIHPLLPLPIKGAIWYQGESNAYEAWFYRKLFPHMIENWREKWGEGDFPFVFVQLANFRQPCPQPCESEWAELRQAQTMALSLPNTGMAVAIDIGEADDIHPQDKQSVGKRLGIAARKIAYSEDIVFSGPRYESMTVNRDSIRIVFSHTGSGLMVRDKYGYIKGFSIAAEGQPFRWARAFIDTDSSVVVYSEEVDSPAAVRYGWADNPDDVNLYNKEGLPAVPFRTDNKKGLTQPEPETP
jgi:sialate O-acetylesterase